MLLTNQKIYAQAEKISAAFTDFSAILPVRINFYLQKNFTTLLNAAKEIESMRLQLGRQYGTLDTETGQYILLPEYQELVAQELSDLSQIEQDIPLHIFDLSDFDTIDLTYQQVDAIAFMIQEE